jgi:hypothetical protein
MKVMKAASIALAMLALFTGLKAAWHRYQSSKVKIDPGWSPPGMGPSEPVDPELQQMGWTVATITAFSEAAALNKTAALWTAVSLGLSVASTLIDALPD